MCCIMILMCFQGGYVTCAEPPLCKCEFECMSHQSLYYDMYGRRYWSCPFPSSPFNWDWDKEKPRKVVSMLTILFSWRVFALSCSHRHQNHWDVISSSRLMTIWHRVMEHLWRGVRRIVPWGRICQAASSHIFCTLFLPFMKVLFPFSKSCQV
jgi:hypothetical protein